MQLITFVCMQWVYLILKSGLLVLARISFVLESRFFRLCAYVYIIRYAQWVTFVLCSVLLSFCAAENVCFMQRVTFIRKSGLLFWQWVSFAGFLSQFYTLNYLLSLILRYVRRYTFVLCGGVLSFCAVVYFRFV